MRAGELLLRHQRLAERRRGLEAELVRLTAGLERDLEVERLTSELEEAKAGLRALALRLRDMDREVQGHRDRMRAHERELMSGRIRGPGDLTRMSSEIEHMKARLLAEEDQELELMSEHEETEARVAALTAELDAATNSAVTSRPGREARSQEINTELDRLAGELETVMSEVPADYRAAYRRLVRLTNPVAEATDGQCGACRVALTSAELQQVRRGDHLVNCQSCTRILVAG